MYKALKIYQKTVRINEQKKARYKSTHKNQSHFYTQIMNN